MSDNRIEELIRFTIPTLRALLRDGVLETEDFKLTLKSSLMLRVFGIEVENDTGQRTRLTQILLDREMKLIKLNGLGIEDTILKIPDILTMDDAEYQKLQSILLGGDE